jgi:hypothetical protein
MKLAKGGTIMITATDLTDSLIGVLKEDHSIEDAKAERLREEYAPQKNVRDFAESKVMAFTPSELLSRI